MKLLKKGTFKRIIINVRFFSLTLLQKKKEEEERNGKVVVIYQNNHWVLIV